MQKLTKQKRIRSIVAASSGNLVEWFDFYIYAFSAVYFRFIFRYCKRSESVRQPEGEDSPAAVSDFL